MGKKRVFLEIEAEFLALTAMREGVCEMLMELDAKLKRVEPVRPMPPVDAPVLLRLRELAGRPVVGGIEDVARELEARVMSLKSQADMDRARADRMEHELEVERHAHAKTKRDLAGVGSAHGSPAHGAPKQSQ